MPEPTHRPAPATVAGWVGTAVMLVGLVAFVGIYDWVREGEDLAVLDQPLLDLLVSVRSPALTWLLTAITTVSGPVVLPILVASGGLVAGVRYGQWRSALLLVGAMATAAGVAMLIKVVTGRARPAEEFWVVPGAETSASFPSGHTVGAATFLLVLGYLAWVNHPTLATAVRWFLAAVLGIGLVAFSRLYLGYHWLTDTVAAMALAVAVLGAVVVVDRRRAADAFGRMLAGRRPGDGG
ncbi:phosphatase PAP2 family protein [Actinotalea sp. M2MS4P-6]|uniref:phosphatase PAP2 family protein n=1 Tax=Actinotalea sp. M2MS4P-6 TaxID=2983762 RepID=UPI0021E4D999|nr:phosphatase PAP2 family protein [Actinotalea sp. M2MS4P-6]MCV2396192.1 phosphatase PAP2 family protein [Actinotalea sp. M2MS4P-6]